MKDLDSFKRPEHSRHTMVLDVKVSYKNVRPVPINKFIIK